MTTHSFDWSRFRLTWLSTFVICAALLALVLRISFAQFSGARDLRFQNGAILGGDYLAFHTAARAAIDGEAAAIYDPQVFEDRMRAIGPPQTASYRLTWQYPPHFFFLVLPLALLPFIPGYVLWTGGTALAFFATMRAEGFRGLYLFVILSAPSTLHAVINGQNGFLTAALLAIATLQAQRRPVVAGLAAALLTVKPQLGVLLPIAYIAGRCWLALFWAAGCSIALAAASTIAFGADVWPAFLTGAGAASANLVSGSMPLFKMATPFAAARLGGLPVGAASIIQVLFAILTAAGVAIIWRRIRDPEVRAAALCAGVFFCTPYAYYYEFVILALPAAVVAQRAILKGWLPFEQAALSLVFLLPFLLPGDPHQRIGLGFTVVTILAASVIRRIAHDHPEMLGRAGRTILGAGSETRLPTTEASTPPC